MGGGGPLKNDVIPMGGLEIMTHDDRGEGGVKNCQNGGDIICGWPLMQSYFA